MMKTKPFQGASVFMSRSLVPPELFDTLHDALKLNGADVFLCCDPSRNGPSDFHVISSPDHEKFEDLRAKGCKLVGPQCVVSCAKERRPLPQKRYTCCLAMDGVKVLASGFEVDEKAEIEKLVTSMGGVLQTKTSADVSFVIAKNVLAAKYKWALNVLKKPVVTINWLYQCRNEHHGTSGVLQSSSIFWIDNIRHWNSCRCAEGDSEVYHTKWWEIFCRIDQEVHSFNCRSSRR